jgi:hypothetical protein
MINTPHIARKDTSILDGRTTRHEGYGVSQQIRKRVEEFFGWIKTIALFRKLRYVGEEKIAWDFTLGLSIFNLVRMCFLGVAAS